MFSVFTIYSKFSKTLSKNSAAWRRLFVVDIRNINKTNIRFESSKKYVGIRAWHKSSRLFTVDANNIGKKDGLYGDNEYQEQQEKGDANWKRMKITLIVLASVFGLTGAYLMYALGSPRKDESGNIIEDEFTTLPLPLQFIKRMFREIENFNRMMRQPTSDKLLPDPVAYPYYQPEYTLILEMNDLLIHADWTYQTGWRFKKRPGVDKFLELVTVPMFELVVFTAEQGVSTIPLLEALDPNGYIVHKLTRESTEFADGCYVKNLDYLNRDLSKVIVIDWNKNSVKYHRDNTIIIPRWNGHDDDTTLVDLAVFLRAIINSGVEDVREVLSYYSQFENPLEAFRDNQRKLLEQIEEDEQRERDKGTNFASKWANTFLKLHRT